MKIVFNNFRKNRMIFFIIAVMFLCQCEKDKILLKPPEIIEFLTIDKADTNRIYMDEVIFLKDYNLCFESNADLKTDFDLKTRQLILIPVPDFYGLTMLNFSNKRHDYVMPVIVKDRVAVTFSYTPDKEADKVLVMGSFNTWNRSSDPMFDKDGDGTYSRTIYLDDGVYEYQLIADDSEFWDPENPEKVDNGFGSFNSLLRVSSPYKSNIPHLFFLPAEENKIKLAIDSNISGSELNFHVLLNNSIYPLKYTEIIGNTIQIDLSRISSENRISVLRAVASYRGRPGNVITAWIKDGKVISGEKTFLWQDAIIYSLMTDRFCNGDKNIDDPIEHRDIKKPANFQGGDFAGIIQKIEEGYFDDLGINTIWISPVNKTTDKPFKEYPEPHRYYSGYHGYWPVSFDETEPRFGSLREFRNLVKIAHKHDIKILLDFVSNHTHIEHPYFREHRDWYGTYDLPDGRKNIRRWNEFRLTTWFDTFLASFDFVNSKEAREAMVDNAVWWMQETGVDGFRHDATKHIPYSFWKELTNRIKSDINPDRMTNVYQIGETFGSHQLIKSYVNNGMLDSQFNFGQFFTQRRIFAEKEGSFQDLEMAINKSQEVYGYNHLMGNIMDSHDQVRMMALLDGDMTLSDNGAERAWQSPAITVDHESSYRKEFALMTYLMTVPGVPIIYYGGEYGMTGANDPDNRRMMKFGNDLNDRQHKQLDDISQLIKLRKTHSALRRGDYLNLFTSQDAMIYSRGDSFERLLIVVNKNEQIQNVDITLPDWMKVKCIKSLIDNTIYQTINNSLKIEAMPFSGNVYILDS